MSHNTIIINGKDVELEQIFTFINENGLKNLSLQFQDGAIGEVGINGVQWTELLMVALAILQKFNKNFPCRENSITITKIEEAIMWQESRTKNRIARGVEGVNKA
jgi:hypothetical protein